jgi:hypothetical protein
MGKRREMEDNIKMDLRDIGCENEMWVELGQNHCQWQDLVVTVEASSSTAVEQLIGNVTLVTSMAALNNLPLY